MKTKIERDLEHRSLINYSNYLHRVFNCIFPSTPKLSEEELGGRLRSFSKIISCEKFDLLDQNNVDFIKSCNIHSRAGRKKFVDSLVKNNLVIKNNGFLVPTKEGELIWKTLLNFKDLKSGKVNIIKEKFSYYEYRILKIETDGSDYCRVTSNLCLKNCDKEPVKSLVFEANSDTPLYKDLELEYSNNISKYEIIENNYNQKTFRLYFKKPILQNEIIEFWYSYEWPGMFLNSWPTWDYSITSKNYPIKFFMGVFMLNKEYNIIKNSFLLNKTELQKDSKIIGKFSNLDPLFSENSKNKEIVWKMVNVPSKVKYKFSWEHR